MVRHSSRIELSQSALKTNFNFIRKKVNDDTRLSAVVKANAYGHGIEQYIPMAEKCGINHFSVASAHEAEEVLNVCSTSSSIMIMGIMYDEDLPWAIENEIEFYVFDTTRLEKTLNAAKEIGKQAKVHLEVETGANRTGLIESSFKKTLTFIKKNQGHFSFEGLCTHFGGAESLSNEFKVTKQFKRFQWYYKQCKTKNLLPKNRHLASSAATFMYPESHYEMVRVGVAQYGFWPSPDIYYHHLTKEEKQYENGLKRVFTWKTDVMDIRTVKEGEFIGYGTAYQATHEMRIAVLPLGYSNGYPRAQSNRGHVLIRGKKAPIVGLINMNLFMVDVTHIPNAEIGDEVVLIGRQKNNVINVTSFTNSSFLLNQEMMSRLPSAIPRRIKR
jgi:alanine racemase